MSTSFGGTTLFVMGDSIPRDSTADVNMRHIPGGNQTYIDIGGRTLPQIVLSLLFLSGLDAVAFTQLEGSIGTLVAPDGTYTAMLWKTHRTQRSVNTNGTTVVQATFVIV